MYKLISRIYKQFLQSKNKNQTLNLKNEQRTGIDISSKTINKWTKKHKKSSLSLIIKEMQMKSP